MTDQILDARAPAVSRVMLCGQIMAEPQYFAKTDSKRDVCDFRLYQFQHWRRVDQRLYVWVKIFGRGAAVVAAYKRPGDLVFVDGGLAQTVFEDRHGRKRRHTYVIARHIQFLWPSPRIADKQGYVRIPKDEYDRLRMLTGQRIVSYANEDPDEIPDDGAGMAPRPADDDR